MNGPNILGYKYSALANKFIHAFNPSTKKILEGMFHIATEEEIDEAMQLAQRAFKDYKQTSGKERAAFLNAIAKEILALGDPLIQRAMEESGLPEKRIRGERERTINQLHLFAKVAEESSWVEASIDTAIPDRKPIPKKDLRKMLIPIGPVVVFTASNFPLAFSTAGGDTASALASGCPVVVKAHEAHLGTNALVAIAIQRAAERTNMPDGTFSALNGKIELGQALVNHPLTKAVAFTGSLKGGKALFDAAGSRKEPIPVFAEMGSVNPVFILEKALQNRAVELAKQYARSVTSGVGQFCTNPGLLIAKEGANLTTFITTLVKGIQAIPAATMLNEKVCTNYHSSQKTILAETGVKLEGELLEVLDTQGRAAVASVSARDFIANPQLQEEIFGPFTMVIKCTSDEELLEVATTLKGQLTGTIIAEKDELKAHTNLITILQDKVGRILLNGVPTGVEVCPSMQHGGPYPATTDSRFTSVGRDAIKRFARPITYQNWEHDLLPDALKDANPLDIWRFVDSKFQQ